MFGRGSLGVNNLFTGSSQGGFMSIELVIAMNIIHEERVTVLRVAGESQGGESERRTSPKSLVLQVRRRARKG